MFYPTTCVGFGYGSCTDYRLADFLGSMVTSAVALPGGSAYCPVSARPPDLPGGRIPTRFNALFRQRAGVSLLRLHVTPCMSNGMLTVSSIGYALRLCLRSRLTLIRLALIRKPWSCGGGVSRTPCRYLYLHLLFRCLQQGSRPAFDGPRNAPLPTRHNDGFHAFGTGLMPDYYPCGTTRLVSCYALFK